MIETLSRLCGERWPRLLPPMMAASYCGMLRTEFMKVPELMQARKFIGGKEKYDRFELDRIIDKILAQNNSQNQGNFSNGSLNED